MKHNVVFRCAILVLWCVFGLSALAADTSFDEVIKSTSEALKEGNAKKLATVFDNSVNLSLKREEGAFTKFQAELLLNDFFRANKVDELKEMQRANNANTSFVVFSLKANSSRYRVFIKFVQVDNKGFKVAEIRIE